MMNEKEYNNHLITLWLDNDLNNYQRQGRFNPKGKSDKEVIDFVSKLDYQGDREHISFKKKDLNMSAIRRTLGDNYECQNYYKRNK